MKEALMRAQSASDELKRELQGLQKQLGQKDAELAAMRGEIGLMETKYKTTISQLKEKATEDAIQIVQLNKQITELKQKSNK
mmetsp:Transcript_62687/g.136287  ORF Transcript_62687/g.136287 Transcript_62687/m.136287 type:complete len:82 (-) Transcript_62687:7-252(-)